MHNTKDKFWSVLSIIIFFFACLFTIIGIEGITNPFLVKSPCLESEMPDTEDYIVSIDKDSQEKEELTESENTEINDTQIDDTQIEDTQFEDSQVEDTEANHNSNQNPSTPPVTTQPQPPKQPETQQPNVDQDSESEMESEEESEVIETEELITEESESEESETETEVETDIDTETESESEDSEVDSEENTEIMQEPPKENPEDKIYSFLQGTGSWYSQRVWSGEWSTYYYGGKEFADYGCGLCSMANIYSTLTPYVASPLDMFQFARQSTGYNVGAIAWGYMKTTLEKCGFNCSLGNKPGSYSQFQEQVKNSACVITLISSRNDSSFWTRTSGHYVTLFLYDEETDTVFLSDSGYYDKNRTRIPLYTVYKALKTGSNYQVLYVSEYSESTNSWKHNGIGQTWVKP